MGQKSLVTWVTSILVVVGALNWGLVGVKSFSEISYSLDLVAIIFGSMPWLASVVYLLVGLSGIWLLIELFKK